MLDYVEVEQVIVNYQLFVLAKNCVPPLVRQMLIISTPSCLNLFFFLSSNLHEVFCHVRAMQLLLFVFH
jgi:hypothetical protein